MAAYKTEHPFSKSIPPFYILFQQGNYQILNHLNGKYIENGKLLVHRGISGNKQFIVPQIDDKIRDAYKEYLAYSFSSPIFALFYDAVYRSETNHVSSNINGCKPLEMLRIKRLNCMSRMNYHRNLEQSFSVSEYIAGTKFGPNFVSFEVPLDNLRILADWAGENEVFILDTARAVRTY